MINPPAQSLRGLVVSPPQEQAKDESQAAGAEYEWPRNGNRDPSHDNEANGYDCAGAIAGNTQAAVSSYEAWFP